MTIGCAAYWGVGRMLGCRVTCGSFFLEKGGGVAAKVTRLACVSEDPGSELFGSLRLVCHLLVCCARDGVPFGV